MTPPITETRAEILYLLIDHRILTTSQIHREVRGENQQPNQRRDTWRDLARLRELEMIKGFPLYPDRGNASEFYWYITKKGAEEVNEKPPTTKIKIPDPNQILFKSHQLELARQATKAHFLLVKPQHYNAVNPKPYETEQNKVVDNYLQNKFGKEAYQTLRLFVRRGINDYVAYNQKQVFIFVLCPPNAGRKFWEGRADFYKSMAERFFFVSAIFTSPEQRTPQLEKLLRGAKFELLNLSEIENKLNPTKNDLAVARG